jgi:hypothetical protein
MKIVRIFMPRGAHLRFEGVTEVAERHGYVTFLYQPRDEQTGNPKKGKASATFYRDVICGWSEEDSE